MTESHLNDRTPLKPTQHLVLLLLAREPCSGIELLEAVERESDGAIRLNAGSLYRILGDLVDRGYAGPVKEVVSPTGLGAPRKLYRVTRSGRSILAAEARRQANLLEIARDLELWGRRE